MERVTWRGTSGVGDFMWALNVCHLHALEMKHQVNLEFHWPHNESFLYHCEDPETIIQRLNYIHNFYHRKNDVIVSHRWDGDTDRYEPITEENINDENKSRYWFESDRYRDCDNPPPNSWLFRRNAFQPRDPKKIVIWRPLFNAEIPRLWKRRLTNDDWEGIIKKLRRRGMKITELCYRTPVREALYHISTCRLVICYDGMWHYIAKNFATPLVVISRIETTNYHTPHAIRAHDSRDYHPNIFDWTNDLGELLGHSKRKAIKYFDEMSYIYEN